MAMTQDEFFGAIEWNLKQLIQEKAPLPEYNLPCRNLKVVRWTRGVFRARRLLEISKTNPPAPKNVRVWDLVGMRLFGGRPLKFRVFACYADHGDAGACKQVKFDLRKWYELSGLTGGCTRPYSCALVIGCGEELKEDAQPTGFDLPGGTPFEMWTWKGMRGPCAKCFGAGTVGQVVSRAMTPEAFDRCKDRVRDAIDSEHSGHVTVEVVAEKTGVGEDVVSNIFNDLVKSGKYVVGKLPAHTAQGERRTLAQRMYIERGTPGLLQQFAAKRRGNWYVQDGFIPAAALSVVGIGLLALEQIAAKVVASTLLRGCLSAGVLIVLALIVLGLGIGIVRGARGGR